MTNSNIEETANEAAITVLCLMLGIENPSPKLLSKSIEIVCSHKGLVFENETAEFFFSYCVERRLCIICPELYRRIYPAIGMDKKGNYTTNQAAFA